MMSFMKHKVSVAALVAFLVPVALGVTTQQAQASENLTRDDVKQIIAEYLQEEPGIVMQALQAHQEREQQRQAEQGRVALQKHRAFLEGYDKTPFIGNPDGDVVVVEFFDYNCGFCKRVLPDILQLIEKDSNVKIMLKELPILSEESNTAARFALAADRQGKYMEFHTALMEASGSLNEARLVSIARGLGLDVDKLKKDANSAQVAAILEKNREIATEIGIRGTPAFIFGNEIVPGAVGYEQMQQYVDAMRSE